MARPRLMYNVKIREASMRSRFFQIICAISCAPAVLAAGAWQPAAAILTYNIYQSGSNVVIETSGSLSLTPAPGAEVFACRILGPSGQVFAAAGYICTGANKKLSLYSITGPSSFQGAVPSVDVDADSVSGISTFLSASSSSFLIDPLYTGGEIVSSAVFNNKTIANLGFTTTGLVGTWTLDNGGDTINVFVEAPPAPVPAPLPLFGAGAAFAWSRRLRRRIALNTGSIEPQT